MGIGFRSATIAAVLLLAPPIGAESLSLKHSSLPLPGPPATMIAADVDGDARLDLAVVVAYSVWENIGIEERAEMDEVDGWVEVLTVVPTLFDRRELWLFLDDGHGGYRQAGPPLTLGDTVHSLVAGSPAQPILALTDEGVSALEVDATEAGPLELRLTPHIRARTVFRGTGAFISDLDIVQDLDGDGVLDLVLPTPTGFEVYRGRDGGLDRESTASILVPTEPPGPRAPDLVYHRALPHFGDLDGDGTIDLLLTSPRHLWDHPRVLRGLGDLDFAAPASPLRPPPTRPDEPEVVFLGDLDGDGKAEIVGRTSHENPDAGLREGLRQAKRPPARYHFYRTGPGLAPRTPAYRTLDASGYAFDNGGAGSERDGPSLPAGFRDLDGDGRLDLVTLTLDFSVLQAVRILTVRSIDIGVDFHVWCQAEDGELVPVEGLDLSGRFKIRLDDARLGRLAQFAGDFDGDGRADFVQMGRGSRVTIHRGRPGCRYPAKPDLSLELAEAPRNLALVRVMDLDGDGRADLAVTQPGARTAEEPSAVRIDVYRSAGEVRP